jgi:predicted PurR-regulated permease PerM
VQTIDGLILGTIVTIELYILRSPYALVLGIMLGIVNYIPYFGSIIGSAVAVVVIAFTQGIPMAAIAAAVLLITQQIDGNIIQPKLMGSSFALSPLLIIISVTVGGALAGVFGMIIAIPIVAVLKDIFESIVIYNEKRKFDNAEDSL